MLRSSSPNNQGPTAVIAEDEPLLAESLRQDLGKLWPDLQIVATARNGHDALQKLTSLRPDIAFLDIRMPGMSGIEVAQAIAEDWDAEVPPPLLVFVTAFDEFALDAFERAAVDYLLKPVQPQRLAQSLERVQRRLRERHGAVAPTGDETALQALVDQLQQVLRHPAIGQLAPGLSSGLATAGASTPPLLRTIKAGVGDTVKMVPVGEVVYLQASDKYVSVVTATSELLIREPLKELMPRLDPHLFAQIHRGTVVNLDQVGSAIRDERGRTWLTLRSRQENLLVSRLYTHLFRPM